MSETIKYVISFFKETKTGVTNSQILFDSKNEALNYAHDLCICSNINSVCLETLFVYRSETSVLKD